MKNQIGHDLRGIISNALSEDIGDGDHTSLACIPSKTIVKAELIVKQNGIIAGLEAAKQIFCTIDEGLKLKIHIKDGALVKKGDIVFTVEGNAQSILKSERIVLNCMQRMSGIASQTHQYVQKLKGYKTKLLDTRKTTPGFRALEKSAVEIGGGRNHRFGLYDMMMIKDNHIDYSGGISQAIKAAKAYNSKRKKKLKIEIEVRNFVELEEVLKIGTIDRIMLDNFSPSDLKKAIKRIDKRFETEASGNITLKSISAYAASGVDFISVGALTHSYRSMDLSLKAILKKSL